MPSNFRIARVTSVMDGDPLWRNRKDGTRTLVWAVGLIESPNTIPPRAWLVAEYNMVNDDFSIGVAYNDELELYIKPPTPVENEPKNE